MVEEDRDGGDPARQEVLAVEVDESDVPADGEHEQEEEAAEDDVAEDDADLADVPEAGGLLVGGVGPQL